MFASNGLIDSRKMFFEDNQVKAHFFMNFFLWNLAC